MPTRTLTLVVSAVVGCAGVAVLAVAWATGGIAWLLADVPGAANDVVPGLVLGLAGAGFLAVALLGAALVVALADTAASSTIPHGAALVAVGLSVASLGAAVVGSSRWAARSASDVLAPVVPDLDAPAGGGRAGVLVGLALAVAAYAVLTTAGRRAR
ncbi:hypothetical protein [Cellulomonas cellasea]|uniref:Uncharacterized protein n=1 Tax=Cellulomonas cellasea TaxID=43670 RepID=A0A4Y3L051_9CELL|nr:hypothetical protein [Cellulomonas cellasea]GEA89753.1 hypothetical protein CCE01nite_37020 [Cellulomonas cellasea]